MYCGSVAGLAGLEGTKPMIMEGTRPPTGASPTQPFNAVSILKSKSKSRYR